MGSRLDEPTDVERRDAEDDAQREGTPGTTQEACASFGAVHSRHEPEELRVVGGMGKGAVPVGGGLQGVTPLACLFAQAP